MSSIRKILNIIDISDSYYNLINEIEGLLENNEDIDGLDYFEKVIKSEIPAKKIASFIKTKEEYISYSSILFGFISSFQPIEAEIRATLRNLDLISEFIIQVYNEIDDWNLKYKFINETFLPSKLMTDSALVNNYLLSTSKGVNIDFKQISGINLIELIVYNLSWIFRKHSGYKPNVISYKDFDILHLAFDVNHRFEEYITSLHEFVVVEKSLDKLKNEIISNALIKVISTNRNTFEKLCKLHGKVNLLNEMRLKIMEDYLL